MKNQVYNIPTLSVFMCVSVIRFSCFIDQFIYVYFQGPRCERFATEHHKTLYILVSFTNFNAQFPYSITICILHYNPRHVSSINMPIFMRTVCRMGADSAESALIRHTVQTFTESDDTNAVIIQFVLLKMGMLVL